MFSTETCKKNKAQHKNYVRLHAVLNYLSNEHRQEQHYSPSLQYYSTLHCIALSTLEQLVL